MDKLRCLRCVPNFTGWWMSPKRHFMSSTLPPMFMVLVRQDNRSMCECSGNLNIIWNVTFSFHCSSPLSLCIVNSSSIYNCSRIHPVIPLIRRTILSKILKTERSSTFEWGFDPPARVFSAIPIWIFQPGNWTFSPFQTGFRSTLLLRPNFKYKILLHHKPSIMLHVIE